MTTDAFTSHLTTHYEHLLCLLQKSTAPRANTVYRWLSQNKTKVIESELKFFIATKCPPLDKYEKQVSLISSLNKRRARNTISCILGNAKSKLRALGLEVLPADIDHLDIVFHKLHGLRCLALRGALHNVAQRENVAPLPQEVLATVNG